jgi:hypothetical protein
MFEVRQLHGTKEKSPLRQLWAFFFAKIEMKPILIKGNNLNANNQSLY